MTQSTPSTRIDATSASEHISDLRHHLRNRLAAIRNAAYYVQRQAAAAGLLEQDPRVERFLQLIKNEVAEADNALTNQLTIERLLELLAESTRKA